jgi:hypothetical protein
VKHSLVVLAALAVALFALERSLSPRAGARAQPLEYARLLEGTRAATEPVAGLRIALEGQRLEYFYVRTKGRWVCASAFKAPCDDARVEAFIQALSQARGLVRSEAGAAALEFGLESEQAIEVSLHGRALVEREDRDLLARLKLDGLWSAADSAKSGTSRFAQVAGRTATLETVFDAPALLGTRFQVDFPPLLDVRLVPQAFPSAGAFVEQVRLDVPGREPLELVRAPREVVEGTQDPLAALSFTWSRMSAGAPQPVHPMIAEGYATFLLRAPYVGLADPRTSERLLGELGARARIALRDSSGASVELVLGAPALDGSSFALNAGVPLLGEVEGALRPLLLPEREAFAAPGGEKPPANPWDAWLRANVLGRR